MKKICIIICLIIAVLIGGMAIYLGDYYHASDRAEVIMASGETISKRVTVFRPTDLPSKEESLSGLIFYPGGKVEVSAYAPLMKAFADQGILCVLLEMPGNLAVLDRDAADGILEMFPEVENWYIGGHSLGGAMASAYAEEQEDEFEGLVLLASYSTKDVSDSGFGVISIYGSEDQVLNRDKYLEYKGNLPEETVEMVIQGGNHAYFGDYGLQEGDGEASITCEEQIQVTAVEVTRWINARE